MKPLLQYPDFMPLWEINPAALLRERDEFYIFHLSALF